MLLNSLGRVLVVSGLVAVTSFMASTAAFADPLNPNSANAGVSLHGNVLSNLVFTASNANDLTIETLTTAAPQLVSTLTYSTNAKGLKVVAGSSSTPFVLTSNAANSPTIPYELAVAGEHHNGYVEAGGVLFQTEQPNAAGTGSASLYIRQKSGSQVSVYPGYYWQDITLTATDK